MPAQRIMVGALSDESLRLIRSRLERLWPIDEGSTFDPMIAEIDEEDGRRASSHAANN